MVQQQQVFSIGGDYLTVDFCIEQGDKKIIVHLDKSVALTLATALKETAKRR